MNPAIAFLRRRTVWRALHAYRVWIGRAIGWWSIIYLIFWIVIFALSGAEMIVRQDNPFSLTAVHVLGLLIALAFLGLAAAGRAPPVILDRRDLYRMALAPAVPRQVMRYRMNVRRSLLVLGAALAGALWSLLAPPYFHLSAPWAAPAAALLALTYFEVKWLRYAGFRRADPAGAAARRSATTLILAVVVSVGVPALLGVLAATGWWSFAPRTLAGLSPLGALLSPNAAVLILPLALAVVAHLAVRSSLATAWPPRYAAQSLVLTQLQAMRTYQLLAGMAGAAGAAGAREADTGERQRLLAALHDRPGATRPTRSLKPPSLDQEPWQAIAWRGASLLYRRPRMAQLRTAMLAVAAAIALLAAAQPIAGARLYDTVAAGAAGAEGATALGGAATGGLGASFAGAIFVLLAAFVMARAAAALIGPVLAVNTAPIAPNERTRGRVTPALVVLGVATVVATPLLYFVTALFAGGAPVQLEASAVPVVLGAYAVLMFTCVLTLEKYSSWSGASPGRWEPQLVAALVVALPVIVFVAFDAPSWTLPAQAVMLAVLWLIEV